MIPQEHIDLLKVFIGLCKANPDILHDPKLVFFTDFIKSLGATIPPKKDAEPKTTPTAADEPIFEEAEEAHESEIEESDLELDTEGVLPPDPDVALPMGDEGIEVTDEMMEQSNDYRSKAQMAISEGNYEQALEAMTEAIKKNPGSAALHAKRANILLHLKKPNAAIKDGNKALTINPDSAAAYKVRGRANRLLGKFEEAHKDLATACKLDYDDEVSLWMKEIELNVKKIQEHKRKHERKLEEREERKRQERRKKAQEAYEKAKAKPTTCCEKDEDCGNGHDNEFPGGLGDIFNDPEVMTAFQDPEVMKAFADVSQNPMNMFKYQDNPKVKRVLEKLATKMGGPGGMGGVPGAFFDPKQSVPPPAGPKPDIDID